MDGGRIGFVGAGHRGRRHLHELYQIRGQNYFRCESEIDYPHRIDHDYSDSPREWAEDVSDLTPEVSAIFDPSPSSLDEAARVCREQGDEPDTFTQFDEFLETAAVDAVMITSPNEYHLEQSVALLERDIDTFCEKPVAITMPDHDELIDVVDRSSGLYYVGFNLRTSPFYSRLKELIDDGAVGELGMVSCRESRGHFHADYSFDQDGSGGTFLDKNCHDFDLYNWYVEADPVSVSARGNRHFHRKNSSVTDQAVLIVEYENGVLGALEVCMYAPFEQRVRMYELRGNDGLLRAPNEADTVTHFQRGSKDTLRVTHTEGGHGGADIRQMKRFLRCLQGREEPPATVIDAKKADAVALAGELAIQNDTIVDIDSTYDIHPR